MLASERAHWYIFCARMRNSTGLLRVESQGALSPILETFLRRLPWPVQ